MLIGEDVVTGRRFASVDPSVADPHRRPRPRGDRRARRRRRSRRARAGPRGVVAQARRRARRRALARRRHPALAAASSSTALAVREAGKPWAEADGDVCEAIDFLEYYAQGALALDGGQPLLQLPGERNAMRYVAARRHRRDRAVELPAGDRRRHGRRRAGDRQRGRAQARRAGARVRQGRRRRAARRRRPARRAAPAPRRRRGRQGAGRRPAHPHDRLHRLLRRRPADPRAAPPRSSPASATSSA